METGKRPQTTEQRQRQVITRLKNENHNLRIKIKLLTDENLILKQKLEKAILQIEELQQMVFGKKKKKSDNDKGGFTGSNQRKKPERNNESYRRPTPKENEITKEENYNKETCPHCQSKLTQLKKLEFFVEDILPPEEWFRKLKQVIRKSIITGYCSSCQKRVSPMEIPKQKVTLGENLRQLIVFQSTLQQLSYSQIIDFSEGMLHLKLSEGEIVNILESQSLKLKPAYLNIKENICSAKAVNIDETGWPNSRGNQGNFAWVAVNSQSDEMLFALGQSRGKGNIEKMLGKNYSGIGISDDYGAYKNIFLKGKHALCWAHPHRKIRDLKNSETLEENKKVHCRKTFEEFSTLYKNIREINGSPFMPEKRKEEVFKLSKLFDQFTCPHFDDPEKLKQIKIRLKEQKDCYFVCLLEPDISPDNNKAERALRHLVIKRKKSFGSKTQKGADVLSIIYSVVISLWRKSKRDFFGSYRRALSLAGGGQ